MTNLVHKGAPDEVLVLNSCEVKIDIARLIDHINARLSDSRICECRTETLMVLKRTDGVNPEVIRSIDTHRIEEPVLIARINNEDWVIDGNHRLIKRFKTGIPVTSAIFVEQRELSPFLSPL